MLASLDFAALTGWAFDEIGYFGIWAAGFAGPGAVQILVDLVIVCVLACVWMVGDARARSVNPWPYVAITLAAGCFGPLLYLLRRQMSAQYPPPALTENGAR